MKVALYPRVSTTEQAKEGYSIGEQVDRMQMYCQAMGWQVYKIYTDPGYSGGDTNRPGLQSMIKDVKAGKIDKVVVYKLDRLSRSLKDTLILIEDIFLPNNVDFVSITENFDTNSSLGRAVLGLLGVFAQLERDKIKERMDMGKEARAKEGKWGGGAYQPIGYDYDIQTETLYVNEYEIMQVRELYDLFLSGTPLRRIEKIFAQKGYSHKHGKWTPKTMRWVMRSKTYLGYIKRHDEWYPGEHEATIDEVVWNKAVKLLDDRAEQYKTNNTRTGNQTSYLGGLLRCAQCDARYTKDKQHQRNGGAKTLLYTCYSRSKRMPSMIKDPNCKNKRWKMQELDDVVLGEIKKLSLNPTRIMDIKAAHNKKTDTPNKVSAIKAKIEELENQISRFMDLYGIGRFDIDQVSAKIEPLDEQKQKLEKELENITGDNAELTVEEVHNIVKSFDDIIARDNFDEIRLMIETLIYYIDLDDDKVTIHWKFL